MMLLGEKAGLKVILQPASRGRFNVLPEEVCSFQQLLFWWIRFLQLPVSRVETHQFLNRAAIGGFYFNWCELV